MTAMVSLVNVVPVSGVLSLGVTWTVNVLPVAMLLTWLSVRTCEVAPTMS